MNKKSAKIETRGDYSPGHVDGDYVIYQTTPETEASSERIKAVLEKYNFKLKQRFSTINLFGERRQEVGKEQESIARMTDIACGFIPVHLTDWLEEANAQIAQPLQIEELFFNSKQPLRFLLRGLPGSGKTTLLRYLTHRFATIGLTGAKECIPVYLRLKYLTAFSN